MRSDRFTKTLLTLIAVFLAVLVLRPVLDPPPSRAQDSEPFPVYIEPGVQTLLAPDGSANVMGKMVVDLRNGNIWGFPTGTKSPYPIDSTQNKPPTVRPMLLGRFDLTAMNPKQ